MSEQAFENAGFDDFGDDLSELPKLEPIDKRGLDRDGMKRLQKEHGFDRPAIEPKAGWAGDNAKKEPLKPIQFRLPESEVEAFHEAALAEFGNKHGGKTDLFRLMWKLYLERRAS